MQALRQADARRRGERDRLDRLVDEYAAIRKVAAARDALQAFDRQEREQLATWLASYGDIFTER